VTERSPAPEGVAQTPVKKPRSIPWIAHLRSLAPLAKAVLVKGLFAAATADGTIRVIEAELMGMVGAVLDCPLPPLLDDLDPSALAA
jgi:hypothetical protein